MSDQPSSDEKITSLGEVYWNAAWRLMEKCNDQNVEIPTIEIPLFAGLILAEGGLDGKHAELEASARSAVLASIKEILDVFLLAEKKL